MKTSQPPAATCQEILLPTFCRLFAGFLPTFCRPSSTNTKGNQLNASGVGCMERIPVCRLRIVPQIHIACYANYQILMKTIGTSSMYSKILPGLGKSFCRLFADFLPTFCRLFAVQVAAPDPGLGPRLLFSSGVKACFFAWLHLYMKHC